MKKFLLPFLAAFLFPFSEVVSATSFEVLYADEPEFIETTTPLDDLKGDADFKYAYEHGHYHVADNVGYKVIDLAEYKYGTSGYALYLYIWNCEQDSRFDYDSDQNRVQILNQKTEEYIHLNLEFISKSSTQFYKYKIEFDKNTVSFVKGDHDERLYSITGVELIEYGDLNATDYKYGKTLKYTGYYYNETLECEAADLETLSLEVNAGLYRTASSSQSQTARNDLYYVWFGIDQSLFTKYGNLYAIHCDYYKFDLSDKLIALVGEDYYLGRYGRTEYEWSNGLYPAPKIYNEYRGLYYGGSTVSLGSVTWAWLDCNGILDADAQDIKYFDGDFIKIDNLNTKLTSSYFNENYSLNQVCSLCDVNFNSIKLDESKGYYNNVNITSDVNYDLLSYGSTHNGWTNFWARLRGVNTSEVSLEGIPAIERFQTLDSINNCECLDSDDKTLISNYKSTHLLQDVVCLRFATGVYDSETVYYSDGEFMYAGGILNTMVHDHKHQAGFKAKSGFYAFMDFDVIDVTFCNDLGEKTVLPVVASPVNVWSSLENTSLSVTGPDWLLILRLILRLFGLFVAMIFCFWLLSKTMKFDKSHTVVVEGSNKKRKSSRRYRRK